MLKKPLPVLQLPPPLPVMLTAALSAFARGKLNSCILATHETLFSQTAVSWFVPHPPPPTHEKRSNSRKVLTAKTSEAMLLTTERAGASTTTTIMITAGRTTKTIPPHHPLRVPLPPPMTMTGAEAGGTGGLGVGKRTSGGGEGDAATGTGKSRGCRRWVVTTRRCPWCPGGASASRRDCESAAAEGVGRVGGRKPGWDRLGSTALGSRCTGPRGERERTSQIALVVCLASGLPNRQL